MRKVRKASVRASLLSRAALKTRALPVSAPAMQASYGVVSVSNLLVFCLYICKLFLMWIYFESWGTISKKY